MSEVRNQKSEVRRYFLSSVFYLLSSVFCLLSSVFCCYGQETSSDYVNKGWALRGQKKYEETYAVTGECIAQFSTQADAMAAQLDKLPPEGEVAAYQIMNDVATCYFIQGEAYRTEGKKEKAIEAFQTIIDKYPYAQAFDPRGWYWSLKEKAQIAIDDFARPKTRPKEGPPNVPQKEIKVKLSDEGREFPVNYAKYGKFTNVGTKDYEYIIEDPIKLAQAVGEGIYPDTTSVKFDPNFIKIKKSLYKEDHWGILNKRDFRKAFYKWNIAPEQPALKLFYIADILERSGNLQHAVKAYYAILVHFPKSYGWTYWHTPWYIGKAALYRLKHILRENPQLGVKLKNASIEIINGYDNDIRNDTFIVNPGKLQKVPFLERFYPREEKRRKLDKITATRGGDFVKLVQYGSGDWQLRVNDKPFMIKGMTYAPIRVGESPDDGSLQDWTKQDSNNNGIIDAPYESWVDKNKNNLQDPEENTVGDFRLMKEMGVNTLRLYHQPHKLNKKLIGQMHQKYGIYIIIGDFLGKYTLGSKADWDPGTDYDDPVHKANMLNSVEEMVREFKDTPYVLMWLLGNENVYGLGCNADKKPESFFKFANEAAKLIKELDPQKRPVAIASGDTLYLDIFAKNCPDIDVFGTNSYRGKYGFLDLWDEVKRAADKPAMITEYGAPSYAEGYTQTEAEDFQAKYHQACWSDIMLNCAGQEAGVSIGGFVFEWIDEWWKAYEPSYHDRKGLFAGPFLDGYMHEEWLGLCSQGNGEKSPYLRQLRKAYFTYKELWRQ